MTVQMLPAVIGDDGDVRVVRLDGVSDLSSASTCTAHVWRSDVLVEFACSFVDRVARTVSVPLGASFLANASCFAGTWKFEIGIDDGLATELTFPQGGPAALVVRDQAEDTTVLPVPESSRSLVLSAQGASDNIQINAAITAVAALGGGRVHLLPGTYDITDEIRLKDNVRLEGDGDATILKLHALADTMVVTNDDAGGLGNSNIQLVNLQIDGNGNAQTIVPNNGGTGTDSVYFIRVTNLLVQDCYVHDGNRHNLFVSDSSSAVRINSNRFKSSLGLSNISSFNSTDITIANNVCSNSNETGTKLDTCHTATIIGNSYFNATTIGVYVTGGSSVTITGNAIRGGQQGVRIVSNDYNVVNGNTIRSVSQNGISVFQNVQYLAITGNVIRDVGSQTLNTFDGINIADSGTGCTYIAITGNTIIDSAAKMRNGIKSLNASDFVNVGDNWVLGQQTATVTLVGANNRATGGTN